MRMPENSWRSAGPSTLTFRTSASCPEANNNFSRHHDHPYSIVMLSTGTAHALSLAYRIIR
jgi:hypothetical protein